MAAYATTCFEMGDAADVVHAKLLAHWQGLGVPAGASRDAATAVSQQPRPPVESTGATERRRRVRERLGAASIEAQLVAALSARGVLQELAEQCD